MEENDIASGNSRKTYIFALVFLIFLIVAGGIYLLKTRNEGNEPFQTPVPSATIEEEATPSAKQMEETTELKIEDQKIGTGNEAIAGKKVTVNYLGTFTDGKKFDSSYDRNEPFTFFLGAGQVIKGWDLGIAGMKVGGKRKLTIPSSLGYGDEGFPGAIPGGATLVFEVELLAVE